MYVHTHIQSQQGAFSRAILPTFQGRRGLGSGPRGGDRVFQVRLVNFQRRKGFRFGVPGTAWFPDGFQHSSASRDKSSRARWASLPKLPAVNPEVFHTPALHVRVSGLTPAASGFDGESDPLLLQKPACGKASAAWRPRPSPSLVSSLFHALPPTSSPTLRHSLTRSLTL